MPRMTNSLESWHNCFQGAFGVHHPNPYKLIECLISEQVRTDFIWTRLDSGERPALYTDISAREENQRLLNIIQAYDRSNIGDFLIGDREVILVIELKN
jgi:hypothetical protein